jgi:hypothetical protein
MGVTIKGSENNVIKNQSEIWDIKQNNVINDQLEAKNIKS